MTHPSLQPPCAKITYSASSSQPILDALDALHTRFDTTLKAIETWKGTSMNCASLALKIAGHARHLDVAFDNVKTALDNAAALAPDFLSSLNTKGKSEDTDPGTTSLPTTGPTAASILTGLSGQELLVAGLNWLSEAVLHASAQTQAAKTFLEAEGESADGTKSALPQVMRAEKRKVAEAVAQLVTAVWASADAGARN